MQSNPLTQKDFYKAGHFKMFPEGTVMMYNNLTPRKSRNKDITSVVVFGIQYFILEYLIKQWNENFFKRDKKEVISKYKRITDHCLGKDSISTEHLEKLHDLGYLPLHVKALPEGTLSPVGIPVLTYYSTHEVGYFLPGMLETIMSTTLWQPMTTATTAFEYRKLLSKYALLTVGNTDFVKFQGHDFSMRGMSSLETACTNGAAHLLSFVGTDTIPAIEFLEEYYGANVEKELVGCSVAASEHSVECMMGEGNEKESILRGLKQFPTGILSKVMDTWDITKVVKPAEDGILFQIKKEILERDGKLVIRPDSTPEGISIADLLCGKEDTSNPSKRELEAYYPEFYNKGLLKCLYETFGGTVNSKGYIELDSHIGVIYGDGLGLHNLETILNRIESIGFATTNSVFGFGSYGYQAKSRDEFNFAVKATYGEVEETFVIDEGVNESTHSVGREIFKDPITDDGTKKSAKGLLQVVSSVSFSHDDPFDGKPHFVLRDQVSKEDEKKGFLETVFLDGKLVKYQSLAEIRERLNSQI